MVRGLKFLKDELSVMHRDIKPTNVLINRQGQVKLCDVRYGSYRMRFSLLAYIVWCQWSAGSVDG